MIDPQLFVLVEVFCLLRQLACHNNSLANTVVEIASGYDGHPPRQSFWTGYYTGSLLQESRACTSKW